jgi:hypothetical protein
MVAGAVSRDDAGQPLYEGGCWRDAAAVAVSLPTTIGRLTTSADDDSSSRLLLRCGLHHDGRRRRCPLTLWRAPLEVVRRL